MLREVSDQCVMVWVHLRSSLINHEQWRNRISNSGPCSPRNKLQPPGLRTIDNPLLRRDSLSREELIVICHRSFLFTLNRSRWGCRVTGKWEGLRNVTNSRTATGNYANESCVHQCVSSKAYNLSYRTRTGTQILWTCYGVNIHNGHFQSVCLHRRQNQEK